MARPTSRVSRVLMTGPLAPFADAFRVELRECGYTVRSGVCELRQVARLSCWLEARGLTAAELSCARVDEFLVWQRAEGRYCSQWSRRGGLRGALRCRGSRARGAGRQHRHRGRAGVGAGLAAGVLLTVAVVARLRRRRRGRFGEPTLRRHRHRVRVPRWRGRRLPAAEAWPAHGAGLEVELGFHRSILLRQTEALPCTAGLNRSTMRKITLITTLA
jgi:hypothetical protein